MQMHELIPHPRHLPLAIRSVVARIDFSDEHWLKLRWRIEGAGRIVIPRAAGRRRIDGLWKTTCFELFVADLETRPAYREFNLSPSQNWAVYDFEDYRERLPDPDIPRYPIADWRGTGALGIMDAMIPAKAISKRPLNYGLTAVIEEEGGRKSYWSIAHPEQDNPDFHAPACFAGRLEAPNPA